MSNQNQPNTTWRAWGDHPIIISLGLIVAFIAILSFVSGANSLGEFLRIVAPRQVAQSYYNSGVDHFYQKKYDTALEEANTAIELSPEEAVHYSLRGSILFDRKEYGLAAPDFDKAITLNPNNYVFYLNRGRNYLALGKRIEAISDLTSCLENLPDNLTATDKKNISDCAGYLILIVRETYLVRGTSN